MKFGKVTNLENVSLRYPKEPVLTKKTSNSFRNQNPQVYVGAPIWADRSFVGRIYPPKTSPSDYLYHYTQQFNAIELNATYYTIPSLETVQKWKKVVPTNFKFFPKFPQVLSKEALSTSYYFHKVEELFECLSILDDNIGMYFLQLPSDFTYFDAKYLKVFVDRMPSSIHWGIELRHASWFESEQKMSAAFTYFQQQNISPVISDTLGRRDAFHLYLTNNHIMIRFLGNELHKTDYERLDWWINQIDEWIQKGITEVILFLHQETEYLCANLAAYFIKKLKERHPQLNLNVPKSYEIIQQKLF